MFNFDWLLLLIVAIGIRYLILRRYGSNLLERDKIASVFSHDSIDRWFNWFYVALPLSLARLAACALTLLVFVGTFEESFQLFNVTLIALATLATLCFVFVQTVGDFDITWRGKAVDTSKLQKEALFSGIELFRSTTVIIIAYALKYLLLYLPQLPILSELMASFSLVQAGVRITQYLAGLLSGIFFMNGILAAASALQFVFLSFQEEMPPKRIVDEA